MPNPTYDINALFDPTSANYNAAPKFGSSIQTQPGDLGTGDLGQQLLQQAKDERFISLLPTDDFQASLDKLNTLGGGRIRLLAGTHVLNQNISIPSNVIVEGIGSNLSILDCNTSYSVKLNGTNPYTTGTIAANSGSTSVTGTGTTWTSAMVGQYIFIQMVLYKIVSVASTTALAIVDPYFGSNVSGITYAIATPNFKSQLKKVTVQNASGHGIEMQYGSEQEFEDLAVTATGTGIYANWLYAPLIANSDITANGVNGSFNNVAAYEIRFSSFAQSTTGDGISFNNCDSASMYDSDFSGNFANGASITGCSDLNFWGMTSFSNGAKGIELISGSDSITLISFLIDSNLSDGIKVTGTNTNCEFSSNTIQNNGGYGVNVAASTNSNIIITSNAIQSNTSGPINDLGTNTVIRGNTGVVDNSVSGTFSSGGDGADGTATCDGSTSVAGMTLAGSTYTMSRDVYFTSLTINNGVTLKPNGYRIFCNTSLVVDGTIYLKGNAGSNGGDAGTGGAGGAGGAALADGYLKGSVAGASGGNFNTAGGSGTATANSIGSSGVVGGHGGALGANGGAGGTATASNVRLIANWDLATLLDISSSGSTVKFNNSAGSGGGGGGSNGGAGDGGGGGGAGSSGGIIAIYARSLTVSATGTITTAGGQGGNGGNGTGAHEPGGGGGGGNGGQIILVYNTLSNTGTVTASGGIQGSAGTGGSNPAADGAVGNAGTIYQFNL